MKQHYSEADLLETYYTQPGASMPVMMHLADCEECAARYERLEKKVRGLAACDRASGREHPETFWARQRLAVMRKIDARRERSHSIARMTRVAAAAILAIALGVFAMWRLGVSDAPSLPVAETQSAQLTQSTPSLDDAAGQSVEDSPWQSDELSDYQSMVAWESWVDDSGDQSL